MSYVAHFYCSVSFFLLILNSPLICKLSAEKHGQKQRVVTVCLEKDENGSDRYVTAESDREFKCADKVATAKFDNKINQTGWAFLEIVTSGTHPDYVHAYAAGLAEGQATRDLIQLHLRNTVDGYCDGAKEYCERLGVFMLKHWNYMTVQVKKHPKDIYWRQINFTLNQLMGLIDGYEGRKQEQSAGIPRDNNDIVIHPLYILQQAGDFAALEVKLNKPRHLRRAVLGSGHCSSLVKTAPNNSDLYVSHVTWTSYSSMLRVQKLYKFNLCPNQYPGHTMAFSGYPGSLASDDDFVLLSSGLAVTETTLSVSDPRLYRQIGPYSIFTWMRSLLAHRLARTGPGWARIFAKHNSGTYNNQWTVIDYKLFRPGRPLPPKGLLYVLEQLPGYIRHGDITSYFEKKGYWPSYNIPFYGDVFNRSGSWRNVKKYGDWFTYEMNPRARIFRRDEHKVVDMQSLQKLMRYNNFKKDPLSRCKCLPPYSGQNAISCRGDLNAPNGTYPFPSLAFRDHGATDMKATNWTLMGRLQFLAISGPTHDPLPLFKWSSSLLRNRVSHFGQPDLWNFSPLIHSWNTTLINLPC